MNLLVLKEKYFLDAKFQDKSDFVQIYKYPFLVQFFEPSGNQKSKNKPSFMTLTAPNLEDILKAEFEEKNKKSIKVIIPVIKTDRNPFLGKITVGRTSAQDITIEDLVISKSHCYFEIREGNYYLVDNGSTNGTFLNSNHLKPSEPVMLKDGDTISFATHTYNFYQPETAYDILNQFYEGSE